MSLFGQNPFEAMIVDGKLRIQPVKTEFVVHESTLDLDRMSENLNAVLLSVYRDQTGILTRYPGTHAETIDALTEDLSSMVDLALQVCYNKLRTVAEQESWTTRAARMNTRAPVSNRLEFPAFLSSTLQSIGPLHLHDSAHDVTVVYAPPPNRHQTYGRAVAHNPSMVAYRRLLTILKEIGVHCSPLDMTPLPGSAFTTCYFSADEDLLTIIGPIHRSHYTNDDVARFILICSNDPMHSPFENVCLTVDYVDDAATLTALAAVAPAAIPEGQAANSAGRPSGFIYPVNYFGIKPRIAAAGATAAIPAGCYILGRSTNPIFATYLCKRITAQEISAILAYNLLRTAPAAQPAQAPGAP